MKEKILRFILSLVKLAIMLTIVAGISLFIINKLEIKKEEDRKISESIAAEKLASEEAAQKESENKEVAELIPEKEVVEEKTPTYTPPKPAVQSGDWRYYVDSTNAILCGYTGEERSITLPTEIDNYPITGFTEGVCFYNEKLEKIVIPEGFSEIPVNAFIGCTNLKEVEISNTVKVIRSNAFKGCSSFENLLIPANIERIDKAAFAGLSNLKTITVDESSSYYIAENDILYNRDKTKLIKVNNEVSELSILPSVREIGSYAISNNENLKNLTLSNSLNTINEFAIYNCPNLTNITIPGNVLTIYPGAFYGCTGISFFEVDSANKNFSTLDGILTDKKQTKLLCMPPAKEYSSYNIPEDITYIENYAFVECNIKEITIHSKVDRVGLCAIVGGENMTLKIEKSQTSFASSAVSGWNSLYKGSIEFVEN